MTLPPDGGDLTPKGTQILRRQLAAAEFDWCPEYTGSKAAAPDWPNRCGQWDPDETIMGKYGPLLNTALYLRDLAAVDLDIDHPDDVADVLDVLTEHLPHPVAARFRANSPRCALLYRLAETDARYRNVKGPTGAVEILTGERSKLSAFGLHRDKETKVATRMVWQDVPGTVTRADLAVVTPHALDTALAAIVPLLGEHARTYVGPPRDHTGGGVKPPLNPEDRDTLRAAMPYIPNNASVPWSEWNKIGMALYTAFGGDDDGLIEFVTFTDRGGYNAQPCLSRWDAYTASPPKNIGAGTLFHLAKQHGFQMPALTPAAHEKRLRDSALQRHAQKLGLIKG